MEPVATRSVFDFAGLSDYADKRVRSIWTALVKTDRHRHCCAHHSDMIAERHPDELDWMEAVSAEMGRRGFSLTVAHQDGVPTCPKCSKPLLPIDDPGGVSYEDASWICRPCGLRQRAGNHMNCQLGPVQALPAGW